MPKKSGMATGIEVARISVKVSPDTKKFRQELKTKLEEIEKSIKAKVRVEPKMKGFREEVKAKTKGMKAEVEVEPDVKRKGFFGRIIDAMNDVKGPNFGTGINAAGYGIILAGLLAVAAPLMGIITSALLALPGLVSLVAAPVGALLLGLDGLKKAASTLKGPFEDLKQTMSAAVETQFTPVFEKLKGIFPTLKASLPAVTQGLADMAQSMANVLTSPEGAGRIQNIIGNIGAALSQAAPGVANFTDGLLKLVEQFSEKLPGLADWFNGAGKSFSDWITKMSENGDLSTAFSGLGESLKVVAEALGGMAEEGMKFMSDPEKVENFANGLRSISTILKDIVALSNKLNEIDPFSNMLPALDMSAIKDDLLKPFTSEDAGWRDMIDSITNGWNEATAQWKQNFTELRNTASQVWGTIKTTAVDAWNNVVNAVKAAVGNVVAAVRDMGGQIISAISSIDLLGAGKRLIGRFVEGIKSMAGAVKDAVGSVVGGVLNLIPHSPAKEGPLSGSGWTSVFSGGEALGNQFGAGLESGMQSTLEMAKSMAEKIRAAMESGDPDALTKNVDPRDLKQMLAALEEERKRLKVERNSLPDSDTAGREALKNQMEQIQAQKDLLSYQKDRVKNEKEYSSAAGGDPLVKAASGLMNMPVDFAKATGKQFMSDLGISGDGFISRAVSEGIQYIFQVGSVDEALSVKDREQSKNAMRVVGARP